MSGSSSAEPRREAAFFNQRFSRLNAVPCVDPFDPYRHPRLRLSQEQASPRLQVRDHGREIDVAAVFFALFWRERSLSTLVAEQFHACSNLGVGLQLQ